MKNTKETIVAAIKSLGYNSRQVSVKNDCSSYELTIRDASVNMAAIEAIAKNNEFVSRYEASGEILSGGNTFVFVRIADSVKAIWCQKYVADLEVAAEKIENDSQGVPVIEGYYLFKDFRGYSLSFFDATGSGSRIGYDRSSSLEHVSLMMYLNEQKIAKAA